MYQDDLGGVLSTPLGTEHIPPMKVPTPPDAPSLSANGDSIPLFIIDFGRNFTGLDD